MSTEVQLFKNGVPDYLRKKELNQVTKSLLGGSQSKRISIRGNAFRMVVNGEEIAVSDSRTMKVVIVNVASDVSRSYYDKQFTPGAKISPVCWSADGKTPNAKSKSLQHTNCAECPQNVKGSGSQNSRACKFSRAVAVLLENDVEGDLYALSLPSQSIFGKAENGNMPLNAYALCTARGSSKEAKDLVTVEYKVDKDEEEAPAPAAAVQPKAAKAKAADPAPEDEEEEVAPKKREAKSTAGPAPAKADLSKLIDEWDDE
jgi:hypothetical protein